jgi:galactan endo-1,6-beta-galactosidase
MLNFRKKLLLITMISLAMPSAFADYNLTVNKNDNRGTWEGWGGSLAWWGKGVGGSTYQTTYADLIFTLNNVSFNGTTLPGLGLNIARYNIGGGGLPSDNINGTVENLPSSVPWYKDIDGYWKDWNNSSVNSTSWDWFRDSNQRNLMWAARDRGVKFEFFANAPMWWMTSEKSSAGGALQSWNRRDFAKYLAKVTAYAQKNWGIKVDSLQPFNEPTAGWWNYPKSQEGVNLSQSVQQEILGYLKEELNAEGIGSMTITASDENTMTQALSTYNYFKGQNVSVNGTSTNVASLIGKVNVHAYNGLNPWRDNTARQNLKSSVGSKRLWMSEYGDNDGDGITLAQTITEDLTHLKPTAWIYWQPVEAASSWGFVNGAFDSANDENSSTRAKPGWIYNKYYVFAQFSRFLRPGYKIIGNSDGNSIVAYDESGKKLILITVNYSNTQKIVYDLSSLSAITGTSAAITLTNNNGAKRLFNTSASVASKKITINAEANTIYSIVVTGVTL